MACSSAVFRNERRHATSHAAALGRGELRNSLTLPHAIWLCLLCRTIAHGEIRRAGILRRFALWALRAMHLGRPNCGLL
jgi:hypothetical protein